MSAIPSRPKSRLADHVRACVVADQMIFLDLHRDKYIAVGGHQLPALSAVLLGTTQNDEVSASPSGADLLDECLQRLRRQKLLSDAPVATGQKQPPLPEPITGMDTDDVQRLGQDWRALIRLWHSTWVVSAWMRRHTLAEIATRVTRLRAKTNSGHIDGHDADVMRDAVAAYMRLRPFALTSHDRCLNDSLTLVHFMASRGLFPQWVIGVRVRPFGAHSWVQSGGVVLNDLPERVRAYRPILVV